MEPRPARPADLEAAAAWLGLEETPPDWIQDLETGCGFAVDDEGSPAGVALLRCWGRVIAMPLFLVDPARRGRGHGRRLLVAAREDVLRRDARSFGLEADPFDHASLACLLRLGFKAGPPLIELDWDLPAGEADDPEPAQPPADRVVALASALDADFEPADWLEARLREGARLLGTQADAGDWTAAALVEPPTASEPARLSLLLVDESEPFETLEELARGLAGAGLDRVRLAIPARQADALRALLVRGAEPVGTRLRLGFAGFPERSDLRRLLAVSWR
jgi:GNAT superfamily N-acetyltransferase